MGKEADKDDDEAEEEAKPEIDIFDVEDVTDIGTGEPLFAEFGFEDWALSSLRFELDLLIKFWAKDVNDPDSPDIQEQHFAFYYNRYYKKQLNVRFFGKETVPDLFEMVNDTVALENGVAVRKLRE